MVASGGAGRPEHLADAIELGHADAALAAALGVPQDLVRPLLGELDFVAEATAWSAARPAQRAIMVGDLNIAPLEHDVWSHKDLLKVVSHTPVETEGLLRIQKKGKWVDLLRQHADGLVDVTPRAIRVTARGRLLVRTIAMQFDRHQREARARTLVSAARGAPIAV